MTFALAGILKGLLGDKNTASKFEPEDKPEMPVLD